ncbi:MAG: hypothetical protein FJ399_14475 [Verrucomicrobia bacterium]|nr:hypothetical protein [Verrucomicrobiota bacterium]
MTKPGLSTPPAGSVARVARFISGAGGGGFTVSPGAGGGGGSSITVMLGVIWPTTLTVVR